MDINESKPLTLQQRIKRARLMKKLAPKLMRGRKIKEKKKASQEQLLKRARKEAIRILKKKFGGQKGASYSDLSPTEKMAIDKMLANKSGAIEKIAKRLLPKTRQKEDERIKRRMQQRNEETMQEEKLVKALIEKAEESGYDPDVIFEVFQRGYKNWSGFSFQSETPEQWGFSRVNSFINEGAAYELDNDLLEEEYIFEETVKIKPGFGYWDVTNYPVGGKFERLDKNSNAIEIMKPKKDKAKGYGFMYFGSIEVNGKKVNVAVPVGSVISEEYGAGEWGTDELTNNYKNDTPGQVAYEGHDVRYDVLGKPKVAPTFLEQKRMISIVQEQLKNKKKGKC